MAVCQSGNVCSFLDRSREELQRSAERRLNKTLALASLNDDVIDMLYDALTDLAATRYARIQ